MQADEATLLMVTFCALHDVEAKEKEEVMAVEGHNKALKAVNLDEPASKSNSDVCSSDLEWAARRNSRVASSSRGGDDKRRGKASSEKKKKVDPNACRCCGKTGHWAKEYPNRK